MTVAAQQSYIDSNWWPQALTFIQAEEDAYLISDGKYLQGLISHTVIPVHAGSARGGDTLPDNLAAVISDQADTLNDKLPPGLKGQKWPCSVTLDVYEGPQGWGWTGTLQFQHTDTPGVVHKTVYNYGPETYRGQAWHTV